jgi:hypothetical protein
MERAKAWPDHNDLRGMLEVKGFSVRLSAEEQGDDGGGDEVTKTKYRRHDVGSSRQTIRSSSLVALSPAVDNDEL